MVEASPQPPVELYEPQEESKEISTPEAPSLHQDHAALLLTSPLGRTALMVRNGVDAEVTGTSRLDSAPEKRPNRRPFVAAPSPVTFTTTNQATSSGRRREEDGGLRVDVADFDNDLDDSATLPPAYSEIRHTTGVVGRDFLPRSSEQ